MVSVAVARPTVRESVKRIAGIDVIVVEHEDESPSLKVVFLHGYGMRPEDFAPFAHSLGLSGVRFIFPRGVVALGDGASAWWPIDQEAKALALRSGPRDLAEVAPVGRAAARAALQELLVALHADPDEGLAGLVLAGFSQGGMLACDLKLTHGVSVTGLAMLSASRLAVAEWEPRKGALARLPVFVSHGRSDPDLAFSAGEQLCRFLAGAGAWVQWVPFDGGHIVPFSVWKQLRAFLTELMNPAGLSRGKSEAYGTA